MSVAVTSFQAA